MAASPWPSESLHAPTSAVLLLQHIWKGTHTYTHGDARTHTSPVGDRWEANHVMRVDDVGWVAHTCLLRSHLSLSLLSAPRLRLWRKRRFATKSTEL